MWIRLPTRDHCHGCFKPAKYNKDRQEAGAKAQSPCTLIVRIREGIVPAFTPPPLPSDDKRWKIVNGTMRKNGFARHALIETLHTVQSSFGYLDDDAIRFVARSLRVPLSQAYGVVTFYHYFSLKPPGKHTMTICTGTACYIKGTDKLSPRPKSASAFPQGQTTKDGKISLMTARCVGACGRAPVVLTDGELMPAR
jgi:bidirectional [NiFe] hydrogenase diaphorase subunit